MGRPAASRARVRPPVRARHRMPAASQAYPRWIREPPAASTAARARPTLRPAPPDAVHLSHARNAPRLHDRHRRRRRPFRHRPVARQRPRARARHRRTGSDRPDGYGPRQRPPSLPAARAPLSPSPPVDHPRELAQDAPCFRWRRRGPLDLHNTRQREKRQTRIAQLPDRRDEGRHVITEGTTPVDRR